MRNWMPRGVVEWVVVVVIVFLLGMLSGMVFWILFSTPEKGTDVNGRSIIFLSLLLSGKGNEMETNDEKLVKPEDAKGLTKWHVCADCWGPLVEYYDPKLRMSRVRCVTEGCPCNGYVTNQYVERRKGESMAEAKEAREVLKEAAPWMRTKKTEQDLLAELGF